MNYQVGHVPVTKEYQATHPQVPEGALIRLNGPWVFATSDKPWREGYQYSIPASFDASQLPLKPFGLLSEEEQDRARREFCLGNLEYYAADGWSDAAGVWHQYFYSIKPEVLKNRSITSIEANAVDPRDLVAIAKRATDMGWKRIDIKIRRGG
jgi:hypothetical protein